jgi:hypothetical protein
MAQRIPLNQDYYNSIYMARRVYDENGFNAVVGYIQEHPIKTWREHYLDFKEQDYRMKKTRNPSLRFEDHMPDWEKVTPENRESVGVIDMMVQELNNLTSATQFEFCINVMYDIIYNYFYYPVPPMIREE